MDLDVPELLKLRIYGQLLSGGRLFLAGNGGSAATANHMAEDFQMNLGDPGSYGRQPGLQTASLTANAALLTAIANDYSYAEVFSRQLEHLRLQEMDTVILLSVSGTSENIVRAADVCLHSPAITFLLTGANYRPSTEIFTSRRFLVFQSDRTAPGDVESDHLQLLHDVLQQVAQMWRVSRTARKDSSHAD